MLTEHAFGEFYQRHARAVWIYVYRVTNNPADADDIVQEAFLRLFQADTLPGDEEGLRRYVFRVAGNLIADAHLAGQHAGPGHKVLRATLSREQAIDEFMKRLRVAPVPVSMPVADAQVLWLKAQLIRRWDAQRKVRLPVELLAPFEIAASVAAAVLLLVWAVPSVFSWIPRIVF